MNHAATSSAAKMSEEDRFAAALLDPTRAPPALKSWNGSDPAQRFGVYRNNVVVALVDALAETFPVVQTMVGERFFRAMAGASLAQQLPETPVLANFGKRFPEFIAAFPPAAGLPYLADLARLEFARVEAFHAADRRALGASELASWLGDPQGLAQLRFAWHPSLRLIPSPYPIVALWAAHAAEGDLRQIDWTRGQTALVLRHDLEVEVFALDQADAAFLAALLARHPLGEAVEAAGRIDFDFNPILGLLLRAQVICGASNETMEPS
jgi:hypothetical protein